MFNKAITIALLGYRAGKREGKTPMEFLTVEKRDTD